MKTGIKTILIWALLLVSTGQAYAYPPDNAAVLYYKAFLIMKEPNDAEKTMLRQFSDGNIVSNEQIKLCLESNRKAIKEVVVASQIKNCDWGLDFSEGFATLLPHFGKCRQMAYILTADAKILAQKGDYEAALDRCISIHNLGVHVGNDTILSCLVSRAIGRIANEIIVEILPRISGNYEMLERLRTQLADVSGMYPSMKGAIRSEAKLWGGSINREELLAVIHNSGLSKDETDKLDRIANEHDTNEFRVIVGDYYENVLARLQIAYDLPFVEAKWAFGDLYKEVENAAREKPEAVISKAFLPAIGRILTIDTRNRTQLNAVLAGIEIYIIRAKTGKLPDELPVGLPKDLFSGKDFLYEKTDAGFTLTGQGKDLDKDIVQQYEFKVGK